MSPAVRPSVVARGARAALAGIAATVSALSIAICAAALELVWQGLQLASRHISRFDLLSALLIGLVLAFLVDPLMERIRSTLSRDVHILSLPFARTRALSGEFGINRRRSPRVRCRANGRLPGTPPMRSAMWA
jgi:hypothetical protein